MKDLLKIESEIFCDMDGVIADFETCAIKKVNDFLDRANSSFMTPAFQKMYEKHVIECGHEYRIPHDANFRNLKSVRNIFFAMVSKNPGMFFESLDPLEDGINHLWSYLHSTNRNVYLLTAGIPGPAKALSSEEGKLLWAKRVLKPEAKKLICTEAKLKRKYAKTNGVANILIDDKESTINEWNEDGGIGILHIPKRSDLTVQILKDLGL